MGTAGNGFSLGFLWVFSAPLSSAGPELEPPEEGLALGWWQGCVSPRGVVSLGHTGDLLVVAELPPGRGLHLWNKHRDFTLLITAVTDSTATD